MKLFGNMDNYLKTVKELVKTKPVCVVIGNESVDLDSAVSSISLAFHLNNLDGNSHMISSATKSKHLVFAPTINATREELMIKTEVTYWLQKHQIQLDNLLCRDEIELESKVESFVLVDHHVSTLSDKVIAVLDHRPFDKLSNLRNDCFKNIQEVGSCATLVCDAIRKDVSSFTEYKEIFQLLHGPIVLDTINFDRDADKFRPLDIEMCEFIENCLAVEDVMKTRLTLYNELVNARADVSSLNSLQLLSKDLKTISSDNGRVRVAIPGVDVYEFIKMDNAAENVRLFAQRGDIDVVVLIGMRPKGDSIERFMAIINIKNEPLFEGIVEAVTSMKNPDLLLESRPIDFMCGKFFDQKNVKASRKQILPVIKQILNKY